jgi:hypothetical protein
LKALGYFMAYLKIDKKYDKLLPPERDIKTIQMDICDFITYLRNTGRSSTSVSTYLSAIHKFYSMKDSIGNRKRWKWPRYQVQG